MRAQELGDDAVFRLSVMPAQAVIQSVDKSFAAVSGFPLSPE